MPKTLSLSCAALLLGVSVTAQSALVVRGTDDLGNQLIYDTDLDITWYDHSLLENSYPAILAALNSFTVQVGGKQFSNWRLPKHLVSPVGKCWGGCTVTDELQHLWVTELGNPFGDHPSYNKQPFEHLYLDQVWYWVEGGWYVGTYAKDSGHVPTARAIFVHDGDILATVPLPAAAWLFGGGLLGLLAVGRRGRQGGG